MAPVSTTLARFLVEFSDQLGRGEADAAVRKLAGADILVIGTDEEDWLEDADEIQAAFRNEAGTTAVKFDHLVASEYDDNGWVAGRGLLEFGDGQTLRIRWTAVVRRVAGEWTIFHSHLSVPRARV